MVPSFHGRCFASKHLTALDHCSLHFLLMNAAMCIMDCHIMNLDVWPARKPKATDQLLILCFVLFDSPKE